MTEEHVKQLKDFEFRVRQLMDYCDKLKTENRNLRGSIALKEREIAEAKEAVEEITSKYDNLKLAKIISMNDDDSKEAKKRLSALVREIDKCIALLNE
jgi:chromosome segregation ATPase